MAKEVEHWIALQESILHQLGDSIAWLLVSSEPQYLISLYDKDSSKVRLSRDIGLCGVAKVSRELNSSGRFLAIEMDLNRCIGRGDLLVRRFPPDSVLPIVVEVKSHGSMVEGGLVDIELSCAHDLTGPMHKLYKEISQTIEGQDDAPPAFRKSTGENLRRLERQEAANLTAMSRFAERVSTPLARLPVPSRTNWGALNRVIERARTSRFVADIAERGVWFTAGRVPMDSTLLGHFQDLQRGAHDLGIPLETSRLFPAHRLLLEHALSPIAIPVPMWRVSTAARIAILSGDVLLVSIVSETAWSEALAAEGIRLEVQGDRWVLHFEDRKLRLNRLETMKAELSVAFGGAHVAETARRLATHFHGGDN